MRVRIAILILALAPVAGCRGTQQPSLSYPGSVDYQRHEAQIHDPFPDTAAGPELLGARPRDYDRPYTETRKTQTDRWLRSPWNPSNWFGGSAY